MPLLPPFPFLLKIPPCGFGPFDSAALQLRALLQTALPRGGRLLTRAASSVGPPDSTHPAAAPIPRPAFSPSSSLLPAPPHPAQPPRHTHCTQRQQLERTHAQTHAQHEHTTHCGTNTHTRTQTRNPSEPPQSDVVERLLIGGTAAGGAHAVKVAAERHGLVNLLYSVKVRCALC